MLSEIFAPWAEHFGFANLFTYITFRVGGAVITAFILSASLGGWIIRKLQERQEKGQPIRDLSLDAQESKTGIPTMGGLIIWVGLFLSVLLWARLSNPYIIAILLGTAGFALVGFLDDATKIMTSSYDGVSARVRLVLEFLIAGLVCMFILGLHAAHTPLGYSDWGVLNPLSRAIAALAPVTGAAPNVDAFAGGVAIPFVNNVFLVLGPFFVVFAMIVVVGWANAVNFTDGLDGLAIVPTMFAAGAFALISYMAGNFVFARYLGIQFVPGAGELAVLCAALVGAGMGFLWHNAYPARVFMGDTGSLGIGGLLGLVAVAVKHEFVLAIIGGLFLLEILSVVSQVGWFKLTRIMTGQGRRIFRMAPLHHHFQKIGWPETHIVIRFWILSALFALAGLATLKLR